MKRKQLWNFKIEFWYEILRPVRVNMYTLHFVRHPYSHLNFTVKSLHFVQLWSDRNSTLALPSHFRVKVRCKNILPQQVDQEGDKPSNPRVFCQIALSLSLQLDSKFNVINLTMLRAKCFMSSQITRVCTKIACATPGLLQNNYPLKFEYFLNFNA